MAEIRLETSLDNPELETMLVGLIQLVEISFPGRVRACYLGGSRSDGTAVPAGGTDPNASDLDLLVVFTGELLEDETTRLASLVMACNKFSKIWLDVNLISEGQLKEESFQTTLLTVLVKLAEVFLYGQDIRPTIKLPPLKNYLLWLTMAVFYSIGSIRQSEYPVEFPFKVKVTYPVAQPKPASKFGGYDFYLRQLPDSTYQPGQGGLRWLVGGVLWMAAFRLAKEHGCYTATKKETVIKYVELINDEWTDLVEQIFEYGKLKWRYLVPNDPTEQARLAELCQRLPAFENMTLEKGRAFLLQIIAEGLSEDRKPEVREALEMIDFSHPTLQAWLLQNPPHPK